MHGKVDDTKRRWQRIRNSDRRVKKSDHPLIRCGSLVNGARKINSMLAGYVEEEVCLTSINPPFQS